MASRAERQTTLANIALQFYYVIDLQVNCTCAANIMAAAALNKPFLIPEIRGCASELEDEPFDANVIFDQRLKLMFGVAARRDAKALEKRRGLPPGMLTKSKSKKKGVTKPCRKLYRFCIDCASCASELEAESFNAKAIAIKCMELALAVADDPRVSDGFDLEQAKKRIDPIIDAVRLK